MKIIREVEASTDDKLTYALLRNAQGYSSFSLRVHPVSNCSCLFLNASKILAPVGRFDTEHVLHHEYFGSEVIHVVQKLLVEVSAFVCDNTWATVSAITLAYIRESLARRATHDNIHFLITDESSKLLSREFGQVLFKRVSNMREVLLKNADCFFVGIYRSQTLESRSFHPKREAATTGK